MSFVPFAVALLAIDVPMVTFFMAPQYQKFAPGAPPRAAALFAVLAYAAMISSWPLIRGSVPRAALMGFVIYATYAFTLSTFMKRYPLRIALTEIAWGTFAFAAATWIAKMVSR
jgi:uncharacterized membrane protein